MLLDELAAGFDLVDHAERGSKRRFESGGGEVLIIAENFPDAESPHNDHRYTINDTWVARLSPLKFLPRVMPIVACRTNQTAIRRQGPVGTHYLLSVGAP